MTAFSDTFDKATPVGSDSPSEADDRMRETKAAVQERMDVDHFWEESGTTVDDPDTGEHRKVTLRTGSAPTKADDKGFVYAKDVSDKAELFYIDEDGDEVQITTGGIIKLTSAALLAILANDTFLTAIDNAGTGTVNLIKAGTNDLATLPDSAEMASSAAPVENEAIANKKYVDDNVGSANYTPTAESAAVGSDGVTVLPNGLRIARGANAVNANSEATITPSGFTAVYIATATINEDNNTDRNSPKIGNYTGGTFTIRNTNSVQLGYSWICVGR